jgi:hypothetical protein
LFVLEQQILDDSESTESIELSDTDQNWTRIVFGIIFWKKYVVLYDIHNKTLQWPKTFCTSLCILLCCVFALFFFGLLYPNSDFGTLSIYLSVCREYAMTIYIFIFSEVENLFILLVLQMVSFIFSFYCEKNIREYRKGNKKWTFSH